MMNLEEQGIPTSNTKEDKKQRKQFIIDFYGKWIVANPTKQIKTLAVSEIVIICYFTKQPARYRNGYFSDAKVRQVSETTKYL
jgi:hypothetical protein